MNRVTEVVKEFFDGKEPTRTTLNPDEAVAISAAMLAAKFDDIVDDDLVEFNFTNVTPHSVGVEIQGGKFSKIIESNSRLPVHGFNTYSTTYDG